ncbi:hypothetical protein PG993_012271 [Apiospora rasikravindrae]|uniref:2EXR domain-containing protein n=1 Tax=Apiospora rasikravindrae TaxID=990691 RepID=A0ABR1S230_9PEZI
MDNRFSWRSSMSTPAALLPSPLARVQFSNLPTNVRELIWDYALQPITPRCHIQAEKGFITNKRSPPAVGCVCKESLAVARRYGSFVFRPMAAAATASDRPMSMTTVDNLLQALKRSSLELQRTWFNHDSDYYIVELTARELLGSPMRWPYPHPSHALKDTKEAQAINQRIQQFERRPNSLHPMNRLVIWDEQDVAALPRKEQLQKFLHEELADAKRFPNLRYIDVAVSPSPTPGFNRSWDPSLSAQLFRDNHQVLVIQLEDEAEIERVRTILSTTPRAVGRWTHYDVQASIFMRYLGREFDKVIEEYSAKWWASTKALLEKTLIETRREYVTEVQGKSEGKKRRSQEMRSTFMGPIKFRPVYMFNSFDR